MSNILLYMRGRNKEEERKGRRKNKKNARIDESIHVHVFFGENWPNLKRSKISETEEATPTKIGLHAFHINLYLHGFFELILFFDPHGLNKVHGPKGSFGRFQGKGKRQNLRNWRGHAHQNWLRAFHIILYLHEFFEPILHTYM